MMEPQAHTGAVRDATSDPRRGATVAALSGAAFLMATSAVGPGFLTQTTVFTAQLGASFGFAILVSVLFDLAVQVNVWRVIAVSGRRAPDIANLVMPGAGHALVVLVVFGGLAFNTGNIAGTGLGANALLGLDPRVGAALSTALAMAIFAVREAGRVLDAFTRALGVLLVLLTVGVAIASAPPLGEAALRSVVPLEIGVLEIVTIVGGTVGGYITFAGGHRLLDAGVHGANSITAVQRSALTGIAAATAVRIALFLASLGVVMAGANVLGAANPPAAVFEAAAGDAGRRMFGLVMWAAAITSVLGASYTSVSFLRSTWGVVDRYPRVATLLFILLCSIIFLWVGRPVRVLILAGALNALVLPIGLGVMLVAARRSAVVGEYRHPRPLLAAGWITALAMAVLGAYTLFRELPRLFA